ncbi:YkgJ family cysteine cluster protein [Desulfobulbus rhabdoformis]|uniref:YkgJ family cysteine cluster protein n=1 Tax=Desulfobulbus rhabdoformis TaxID=34032 RepID=UPI001965AA54|nr:YkgJ family cysteine cluster protein [Desulfobulbus rhabdoformis]MBM9614280.1 YkgJ family cysteine cluster protein [Desulfobulbus rhabdoformis]
MSSTPQLPENFQPISGEQKMSFACHPGVSCFTECCRELDLALTPYDALRLKNHLGIKSAQFLDQYVIIEWEEGQLFPTYYLTMVDDGRASCVFVKNNGCTVYEHRPGSCRAYPVGRGAGRQSNGETIESLVLIQEPHCKGFAEDQVQSVSDYLKGQGLETYNRFNDALLPLIQHPTIQNGSFRPSRKQLDQYTLALYDLDQFRTDMAEGIISLNKPLNPQQLAALTGDDEELLLLGIRWLMQEFYGE